MKKAKGQTIIEVLVALAVVSIGLFASAGLVFGNLSLVERDTDRVVATNLAREAIEIAKQIRDSNWLSNQAFDVGLVNAITPGDYTATLIWDGVVAKPSFEFTANAISDANAQIVLSTAATPNGLYVNQNTAPPIGGSATPFKRLTTFSPICVDAANTHTVISSGVCTDIGQIKAGIRIESRVEWTRKGRTISSVIYEDMYDWK